MERGRERGRVRGMERYRLQKLTSLLCVCDQSTYDSKICLLYDGAGVNVATVMVVSPIHAEILVCVCSTLPSVLLG